MKNKNLLSKSAYEKIDHWVVKFPNDKKKSAVLMALRIAQDEHSFLNEKLMDEIALYLGISELEVYEVASFYSMYRFSKVGKFHLELCSSISCKLCGVEELVDYLTKKLNIKLGETTADGLFTVSYTECLAACCGAPAMLVNHKDFYEDLTPTRLDQIISKLTSEVENGN